MAEASGSERELQWTAFKDLTGGLWERPEHEIPSNGLSRLEDGVPMRAGGLEPAPRWTTAVNTTEAGSSAGITPSTGNLLLGFNVFGNAGPITSAIQWSWMMLGQQSSFVAAQQVWLSRSSATTAFNNFTTIKDHTSVRDRLPVRFVQYVHSTAGALQMNHFYHTPIALSAATTGYGVFKVDSNTLAVTQVSTMPCFWLEAHQGRLLGIGDEAFGGAFSLQHQRISFSDDGTDNNLGTTVNSFVLAANRPGDIALMQSRMPQDLAILKRSHGWYNVQGAISINPVIYEQSRVHVSQDLTGVVETSLGLAYLTRDEGLWVYTGGRTPIHLSGQLQGSPMTSAAWPQPSTWNQASFLGGLGYAAETLWTPNGYVWDGKTGAWHRNTQLGDGVAWPFFSYDPTAGQLYAARNTAAGGIQVWRLPVDERTVPRSTHMLWEIPVQYRQGVNISPAEIELYLEKPSGDAQLYVDLIHPTEGADTTVHLPPVRLQGSRFQNVRLRLPPGLHAPWYKARFRLQSLTSNEAPTVGWFQIGHRGGSRMTPLR